MFNVDMFMINSLLLSSIKIGVKNSFNFSGRANRGEFWGYKIFLVLLLPFLAKAWELFGKYVNNYDYQARWEIIITLLSLVIFILLVVVLFIFFTSKFC